MRGVLLDVGGVFLVPIRDRLLEALGQPIGSLSDARCDRAHFEGVHSLDTTDVPGGEEWSIYLRAYLSSIDVPEDRLEAAVEALIPVWKGPSTELWRRVLSGSVDGLRALGNADLRLGIVSNCDGLVQEILARNEICQMGPGPGVQVLTIVDSAVVGVAKPDPRIFEIALPSLGLEASDVIYVGDSVKYDVRSAEDAGMTPLHFDPFGLCDATDHSHVADVGQVLRYA
jgi:putative hydrolase of the HAD superfamily